MVESNDPKDDTVFLQLTPDEVTLVLLLLMLVMDNPMYSDTYQYACGELSRKITHAIVIQKIDLDKLKDMMKDE